MQIRRVLAALAAALAIAGCAAQDDSADEAGGSAALDEEWGMNGPLLPTPPPGKDDGPYRRGLLVATDTTRTQVWTARNRWEDTDTAAARRPGLAWSASSGLSWDEKYARWIESLPWTATATGQTVVVTTPWGTRLPSPALECAEMSIFLRITFAAWYELPFFLEAVDGSGQRVFFGHNGVRTAAGRYARSPEFAIAYRDHTPASGNPPSTWPRDGVLRARKVAGGVDEQPMIAPGAVFGAYLDEIHLNKRAGYFTVMALNYLGSANLADSANTFNLVPEAVRAGDTLILRWQRTGIGHSIVVKESTLVGEGNRDLVTVSGSMPRRQAVRESGYASKQHFTSAHGGGPGINSQGDAYARLGGGLKRWRVARNVGGYWTNTWMTVDEAHWIDSNDTERIAARPARVGQLLGEVPADQLRAELLAQIADARRHLRGYPASCAARERRERAFEDLYDLAAREDGLSRDDVDRAHRTLDDAVLAELVYPASRTCCWNSTTPAMYEVVMDAARAEQSGGCTAPTVFMSRSDGYARWASHAAATGRADVWRAWSEDESCPQRAVAADTEASHAGAPWCQIAGGGGGCTDVLEPNDSPSAARSVAVGATDGLRICDADQDVFAVDAARLVVIDLAAGAGDLDLAAHDRSGARVAVSQSTGNREEVAVPAGGTARVYGYRGATGGYRLTVR
jgi:hypothetical protein